LVGRHDFPEVSAEVIVSAAAGADHALRKGIDTAVIAEWLARFLT
jgi:hypothetical protein